MIRDAQDGDYPQITALQNAHYHHHFDQSSQEMQRSDAQRLEQHGQRFGAWFWFKAIRSWPV